MSKALSIIFVVVLALLLVACGGEAPNNDTTPPTDAVTDHVHIYNEESVAPTCSAEGSRKMVCACGDVQSEEALAVADHTPSAPDCEKDTVCTVCNAVIAPAAGHTMGATETITAATCGTAGKEKATCLTCGKTVEADVPATGHNLAKDGAIKAVAGGYEITCESCAQKVTIKPDAPVFELTFDGDIVQDAENNIGIELLKPESWVVDGGVLKVPGGQKVNYANVKDANELVKLGTFVVSFDFMSTQEGAEADAASIFSFLGNFYNGAQTSKGSTAWGWIAKLNESLNVLATKKEAAKINDSNSIAIERNKFYKIEVVVVPTAKVAHVYIDGKYVGLNTEVPTLAIMGAENLTLRFGDGPMCGYVFDNFKICDLK